MRKWKWPNHDRWSNLSRRWRTGSGKIYVLFPVQRVFMSLLAIAMLQRTQCMPEKWHQTLSCDFHGGSCEGLAAGSNPAPWAPHAVVINLGQVCPSYVAWNSELVSCRSVPLTDQYLFCMCRMTTASQHTRIQRPAERCHLICQHPSSGRITTKCSLQTSRLCSRRGWTHHSFFLHVEGCHQNVSSAH